MITIQNNKEGYDVIHRGRFRNQCREAASDGWRRQDSQNCIQRISAVFSASGLVGTEAGGLV